MNCSPDLIEAYVDDELDAAQRAAIERHVAECPDCSAACAHLRDQKAGIRAAAPYHAAPPELREMVSHALRRAMANEHRPPRRDVFWRRLAIAASVLLAFSLAWNLRAVRSRTTEVTVADSVLAEHLRSLIGTHLVDVASSDQHTVKPWFAGKLDFSPTVKNLDSQGFPLEGGRVEYLTGRRIAALVYRRRQHVISLFVWPLGSASRSETRTSHNGYNLLQWTGGGMTYWAVSDVSAADLELFRKLYEQ